MNASTSESMLKILRIEAEKLLQSRITQGKEIGNTDLFGEDQLESAISRLSKWEAVTAEIISSIFTGDKYEKEFTSWAGGVANGSASFEKRCNQFDTWLKDDISKLETLIEKLPFIPMMNEEKSKLSGTDESSSEPVFVVHGQDEGMNQMVLRFIEKLGLNAIDLREKPGGTLSMQEKLQKYSNLNSP